MEFLIRNNVDKKSMNPPKSISILTTIIVAIVILSILVCTAKSQEVSCLFVKTKYDIIYDYCSKVYGLALSLNTSQSILIRIESALNILKNIKNLINVNVCNEDVFRNLMNIYILCHRVYIELIKVKPNIWFNITKGICNKISERTRFIIRKLVKVQIINKSVLVYDKFLRECIRKCLVNKTLGLCIKECYRIKIPIIIQIENVVITNFTKRIYNRTIVYLNKNVGLIISKIAREKINLTGIDRAINEVYKVLKILKVIKNHLISVNANSTAINALELAISNVNYTVQKLIIIRSIVFKVKKLKEEIFPKINDLRKKLIELKKELIKIRKTGNEKELEEIRKEINKTIFDIEKLLQKSSSEIESINNQLNMIGIGRLLKITKEIVIDVEKKANELQKLVTQEIKNVKEITKQIIHKIKEIKKHLPKCPICINITIKIPKH